MPTRLLANTGRLGGGGATTGPHLVAAQSEEFIDGLSDSDVAAVLAGMEEVRERGLRAARRLDGEIWEVRIDGDRVIYRVLFAEEGSRGQVLLALEGFNKKTQKTPPSVIKLAKRRLGDWRRRGDEKRETQGKRPLYR